MQLIREKRWNPLLQEWVIIAESTANRPWNGEITMVEKSIDTEHDESCYLCPRNTRANGEINPDYSQPFSFVNDYATFSVSINEIRNNSFFQAIPAYGICKVLVYSKNHSLTLSDLSKSEILEVIKLWKQEFNDISLNNKIQYIFIFENKGKIIGVSNSHPHGQLYATDFVPKNIEKMAISFTEYFKITGLNLLQEMLKNELSEKKRIVCENDDWVVIVPYFAQYAYETMLIPRRFFQHLGHLLLHEKDSLASILKEILSKYDALFGFSLPNITSIYNAPLITTKSFKANHFSFFIRFTPPLREADKLKYLAGFETGSGNIINPLSPENAAAILQKC